MRVRKKKKKKLFVLFLFILSLGLYMITRVENMKLGYRKTKLLIKERKLEEENRKLKVQTMTLKSPERLRKKGKELGLSPPSEKQIIFLGR